MCSARGHDLKMRKEFITNQILRIHITPETHATTAQAAVERRPTRQVDLISPKQNGGLRNINIQRCQDGAITPSPNHLLAANVEPADVHLRRLELLQDLQHSSSSVFVSDDVSYVRTTCGVEPTAIRVMTRV